MVVSLNYSNNEFNNSLKDKHVIFRTKEEAVEVAKKILEVLK